MKKKQKNAPIEERELDASERAEESAQIEDPIDEGSEISRLLDEGYSVRQIMALGFKRRTAYHYARMRMQPENDPAGDRQGDSMPAGHTGKSRQELIKLGSRDVIPPEAVLEVLHLPRNGDAVDVWRRGVLDGVGILLLGARYAQLTAAGQADIVKNQLDIMREAKESNKDVAQAAAEQAARMVGGQMQDLVRQAAGKPQSPNPFAAMLSQTMQPHLQAAIGSTVAAVMGQKAFAAQPGQSPQPEPPFGETGGQTNSTQQSQQETDAEGFTEV